MIFIFCGTRAESAQGDFLLRHGVTARELVEFFQLGTGEERNVHDSTAFAAGEVPVLRVVGTVAGGTAVEVDFADEAAVGQRFENIVNRGQGKGFHLRFGPEKNLHRRGVILTPE